MSLSPHGPQFSVEPEISEAPPPAPETRRRIPNMGHALLFVVTAAALMFGTQLLLVLIGKTPVSVRQGAMVVQHPILQMLSQAATYVLTVAVGWVVFQTLWKRSFLEGIRWNWYTAKAHWWKLLALGVVLAALMQALTWFTTPPKTLPVEEFFSSAAAAWGMTVFGVLIAPAFEEICFRGFLVPAFAIAYDFLTLPRTAEAQTQWRQTTMLTPVSMMFSAVVTSILFAWMHSQQIAHYAAALVGLFSVSLLLTIVRVRTQSVAASTLVHAAYNSVIFVVVLLQTGGYRHLERITP